MFIEKYTYVYFQIKKKSGRNEVTYIKINIKFNTKFVVKELKIVSLPINNNSSVIK